MLQRVRELAVQYKNGTLSPANQPAIQTEVYQLASEIERIGTSAEFNGIKLLTIERHDLLPGRRQRRRDHRRRHDLASARRSLRRPSYYDVSPAATISRDRRGDRRDLRAARRRSARCRTASSTRCATSASTRRTWSPPSRASATSTWPRRRSSSPSTRSSAGRHGDARPGQPADPERPVAAAGLIP